MPEEIVDEMSPEDKQKCDEWDRRYKLCNAVRDAHEITQICIQRPRVELYNALGEMLTEALENLRLCAKDLVG